MKPEIKAELLREIALEVSHSNADLGVRLGRDPRHVTYRGREIVSFASWDLLGIHNHPEVRSTLVKCLEQHGISSSSGRYSGGLGGGLAHAEMRIAKFFSAESSLLFSTRNQCVLTAITTLCAEGVVVLGPSLTTLPLADACALVGAEFGDFDGEEQLKGALQRYALTKRVIVVVEAVNPITGEAAPIERLVPIIEAAGAWLVVDESAALGISGIRGAGTAEKLPSTPALVARIVGFNTLGGSELCALVSGAELRELLVSRSRYLRYEMPPSTLNARFVEALLDVVEVSLSLREKLSSRAVKVTKAIKAQGWKVLGGDDSPIVSLWMDSLQDARTVQDALLQRGALLDALPARGIRRNGAVVRALISNLHVESEGQALLAGLDEVRKRTEKSAGIKLG